MTHAGRGHSRRVVAAVAALMLTATLLATARAYNDNPDADRAFPAWLPALPVVPDRTFNAGLVYYELHQTGPHAAEIHFRNVSSVTWHFDAWIPGAQHPRDNRRVTLRPYFETREELRVPAPLRHGRPGLSSALLRVFDIRRGAADTGPVLAALTESALAGVPAPAAPDADWMPVRPLVDDGVVRRSNLMTRVTGGRDRTSVAFRNPSRRDLHFRFEVPALGPGVGPAGQVGVPAGTELSVDLAASTSPMPAALARVVVCDVRVGADTGPLYSEDRRADIGWFPLVTSDASAALPRERLLARVEPIGGQRARVRFRSRMRSPVAFRFAVPGYQDADRENGPVTVEPGSERDAIVTLDRHADMRLALARLRVWDVSHGDDE